MTPYTFTQVNNPPQLDTEIRASSIGSLLDGIATNGTGITAYFTQDLTSDQQTTLAGIVAGHRPVYTSAIVNGKLLAAADFGMGLINAYKVQNVLAGITQSGKTQQIADVLMNLNYYLGTGSLYAAIAEIGQLRSNLLLSTWSPWVTDVLLHTALNQIQNYLGIPLT